MQLSELKQQLLEGKVLPGYLFSGDELAVMDVYIQKIHEIFGGILHRPDSLKSVYGKIHARSLIKRKDIYVIRDDEDYKKREKLWAEFGGEHAKLKDNIVIFVYSSLDKRSKFYKAHETCSAIFDFLSPEILCPRLIATTGLTEQNARTLCKLCLNNYGRMKLEIQKLFIYCAVNKFDINTGFKKAMEIDLIHEDIGDVIFEFSDTVIMRNQAKIYPMFNKLLASGEPPLITLTVLYNSFRNLLILQSTPLNMQTEQITGIPSGQIWALKNKLGHYTTVELVNAVKTIREAEKNVKIGVLDTSIAVEYVLSQIL